MEHKRRTFGLGGFDFYIPGTNSIIEAHSICRVHRKREQGTVVLVIPPARKPREQPDEQVAPTSKSI